MDVNKLKMLAGNIHDNCHHSDQKLHTARIAEHMRNFWAPLMIRELHQAHDQGKVDLPAPTLQALAQLQPANSGAKT